MYIKIPTIDANSQLYDVNLVKMCPIDAIIATCAWEPGSWIPHIVEVCLMSPHDDRIFCNTFLLVSAPAVEDFSLEDFIYLT